MNRAGGTGSPDPNDIWVFHRGSIDGPWGPAENLGMPVNSPFADFCPTPLRGNALLFVSTRPGGCGAGDIYLGRNNPTHGWSIQHLGCDATGTGPNFPGGEFGPALVETAEGTVLFFFSSEGYDVGGDQDIYISRQLADGSFAPATAVPELNTPQHDFMPNVRKGRPRDRAQLEPAGRFRRPGHLHGVACLGERAVVDAAQPRWARQHCWQRDALLAVVGRPAPPLRPRRRDLPLRSSPRRRAA